MDANKAVAAERRLPSPVIRGSEYAAALLEMGALDKALAIIEENRAAVRDLQLWLLDYPDGVTESQLYAHLKLDLLDDSNREYVKRLVTLSAVLTGPDVDVVLVSPEAIPMFKLGDN